MCKAPKAPEPEEPEKPQYLRNPYLDAAIGRASTVSQLRAGRSSLRNPLGANLGIAGSTTSNDQTQLDTSPSTPSRIPGRVPAISTYRRRQIR